MTPELSNVLFRISLTLPRTLSILELATFVPYVPVPALAAARSRPVEFEV